MLRNPVPNVLQYAIRTLDGLSELNRSPAIQMRIGLLHPFERCRLVASYRDRQFQDPLQQFRLPVPGLRFGCRALALDDSGQLAGSELVGVDMPASPVGQLHQVGVWRARVVGGGYNHADQHIGVSSHHLQCRRNVRVVSDDDRMINLPCDRIVVCLQS